MANPRPDTIWLTAVGVTLRICTLSARSSVLAFPWWPLHRVARAAEASGIGSIIHLEEFSVVGQIPRSRLASLWIYLHQQTGRELFVDSTGTSHRLRPFRADPTRGRFLTCPIEQAVDGAGLECGATARHPTPVPATGGVAGVAAVDGHAPDPQPFRHGTGLRSWPIGGSPLSGRYPRWPVTDPPHRSERHLDDLGRCYDARCDRCWVDGDPELSPELREAIAPLYAGLPPRRPRPPGQDLRPTLADHRLAPDPYVPPPPWAQPSAPEIPRRPAPRSRTQAPASRPGPYRPWLTQAWPPRSGTGPPNP